MNTDSKKIEQLARAFVLLVVVVSVAIAGTLFYGCRLSDPDPQSTQTTNSVRRWSQGIVLNFPNPPTEGTVALMKLAKIKQKSDRAWVIERYNRQDQIQNAALESAFFEGAVAAPTGN